MATSRRAYIDWLRGIAVVSMIEWHVIDAWSPGAGREGLAWSTIKIVGGFAAPLFLFLAGVAVPLAMLAYEGRGASRGQASWTLQKRGWQVFGLAHLFRFQSFLVNPNGTWSSLFRPDILNILGLGLAGTAFVARRATTPARRNWWLLLPAIAIALLTPLSRVWWWPTLLYPRLESYIRPVGNLGEFSLFPWIAYVPLGAYLGSVLAESRNAADEVRVLKQIAFAGAAAVILGVAGWWVAPLVKASFWIDQPSTFLITSGAMMLALGASWWLTSRQPQAAVGPLLLLGRTSLFVYWVHVELAYGVISYPLHSALPLPWAIAGFAGVLGLMLLAARWWSARPASPWIPDRLRPSVV